MKKFLNPKNYVRKAVRVSARAQQVLKDKLSVAKHFHYNIDSPRKRILDKKTVQVEGWIIPRQGRTFEIRVRNNGTLHKVKTGIRRPDVAKSHPHTDKALHSGFSSEFEFENGSLVVEVNVGGGFKPLYHTKITFGLGDLPKDLYNEDLSNNYPEHVNLLNNRKQTYYEERIEASYERAATDPRLMAIYLPQFHPFEQNDKAWGRGFTEWANVTAGQPRFVGHQQPILPKDLGFYDLRLESKIKEQIDLAKKYGVYGFAFYYYWFSGKKIMDAPLESFLKNKDWDFNFSICWANENWTKRWDGRDSDVIIAQEYRDEDPLAFIKDVEHILLDKRYITEDGKPVLTVYRASELKDPKRYSDIWREYFRKQHGKELHLVSCLSFDDQDPREYGFDAALDFAPLSAFFKNKFFPEGLFPHIDVKQKLLDINFSGVVADYRSIALNPKLDDVYDFPVYPCITPSWDNDARKKGQGYVFQNSSPDIYADWLDRVVEKERAKKEAPLIYINAWNEWAEGAIMEPSTHLGHATLNRTAEVLAKYSDNSANRKNFPQYQVARAANKKLAVVAHLFYPDLWSEFAERLSKIDEPFDLFVTLNQKDADFTPSLPGKDIKIITYVVPNRGRDVLPFIYVARRLERAGYEYVLKLHSKKSKHRTDGSTWLTEVLDGLVPDTTTVKKIIEVLNQPATGLVGPANHLVSLKRHMGSNAPILENLLGRAYDKKTAKEIMTAPEYSPYIGGTMFWARLDALKPLLTLDLMPDDFQSEHGQVDGTTAHAVERFIGVSAKLEQKDIYLVDGKQPDKVDLTIPRTNKYTFAP